MSAPKLRFKEFAGNWPSVPLKDFVSFRKGKGISKADIQEDGIFQCIRYGELYTTYGQVITTIKSRTNISPSESILSQNGDVIIPASGETQIDIATASCVAKENVILGGDLNILSHQESGEWLAYYLSSAKKLEIAQLAQGNSVVHLYSSQLKELKVNKPTKAEQTKIASFLSAVDEKISQLTQKHQLLSQYKQGMMQKLFSQQIRFKADDGSEFEEWEEKQLGDVCHFINGRAYKQTEWEKEGTPVIRLQNLTGSGKEYYYSTLNLPDHQYCYNNDLLYMWSATFGPIFWQGEKAIFHYHIWKVEVEPQQLDKQYMYYLLDEMTEKMKSSLNGSTMLHVTKQGMESTKKNLPSIEEQTKIANFLSAIDQKIDVVSEQLEQAKLWKKGLLQQMFV